MTYENTPTRKTTMPPVRRKFSEFGTGYPAWCTVRAYFEYLQNYYYERLKLSSDDIDIVLAGEGRDLSVAISFPRVNDATFNYITPALEHTLRGPSVHVRPATVDGGFQPICNNVVAAGDMISPEPMSFYDLITRIDGFIQRNVDHSATRPNGGKLKDNYPPLFLFTSA